MEGAFEFSSLSRAAQVVLQPYAPADLDPLQAQARSAEALGLLEQLTAPGPLRAPELQRARGAAAERRRVQGARRALLLSGVLPRSGFPRKFEKLLRKVFFPFQSISKSQCF